MSASSQCERLRVDLERPVLVCGIGRSGTSLLQSMLNAHHDLCFPPETHFFRRFVAEHRTRVRNVEHRFDHTPSHSGVIVPAACRRDALIRPSVRRKSTNVVC